MAERWIFTKEQLQNTPSRKCGVDYAKELGYRQQAANLIQDMGQRLQVNQLCINTAIVYMHRFYMFQSFARFHRTAIAPACLFLAAKVEEQLRKLEHVIKVARTCLHKDQPTLDTKSEAYLELAQELVVNENILLQSLGFDIQVDHPHTHVVKTCQLVRASKDLAQTSYFLATNSLHLTTMCLQYKPTVVACVCIHIASNWSEYEIAVSHEGKQWHSYVDKSVTPELLTGLTQEFLNILETCPLKLKRKILTWKSGNRPDEEGGPTEKRHKGESSGARLSGGHDKHGGESSKHDKRSESAAKSRRSETVASHTETKPPAVESPSLRQINTPPVPNPVRKSAVPDAAPSRSIQSIPQPAPSAESVDAQKKQGDLQAKPIPFRDYKSYREHKEKQAAAAAAVTGVIPTGSTSQEGERRLHGTAPSGESHKKRKQSSSSSGDEKKIKREREYERKHASHIQEPVRHEEPLKLHIKKERTEESLKVHIKKESGTHKIKPTGSPLKLTIKTLPMNESSPSKSHEKSEHRQEPLKMKLSLKAGQLSSHVERPSKHRRSENYTSHSVTNLDQGKHSYTSSRASTGVDGNGLHNPSQRNVNSHHKPAGHEGKLVQAASQQPNMSFITERGASGSIFSPPPAPQTFDTNMFNTGVAMLSQTSGGHRGTTNVNTSGYGVYHQQSSQSSNFNDSFSSYLPDMFSLDAGPPIHGLETNGGSMKTQPVSMPTKEDLQQMETNMQQIIGRTKQIAQQQLLHQQQQQQQQQHNQARYGYIGLPAYQSNPPLPSVPPPPPPPPEDPPQPPPPPPSN